MGRCDAVTRLVYRSLLRAVERRYEGSPTRLRLRMDDVRREFRCPEMAEEATLDDALQILRNLSASAASSPTAAHTGGYYPPTNQSRLLQEAPAMAAALEAQTQHEPLFDLELLLESQRAASVRYMRTAAWS